MKPPEYKSGNASFRKALNDVVLFARRHGLNPAGAPGWRQSADGWAPPPFPSAEIEFKSLWQINIENSENGEVSIDCGTIIKDASDLSEALTITDEEEIFSPNDGDWIYLKLSNIETPTATLMSGENWEDYPSAYEITDEGENATYAAYYYPLYHFVAEPTIGYTIINENLYYKRFAPDSNFELIHTIYRAENDAPLVVHKLISSHAVLPP